MRQILTQEKAAALLKELQYAKAQMGQLSIKDEYFKQALEKQPRWIACSERMPEDNKDVLCLYKGGGCDVLFKRKVCWDDGDFHSAIPLFDITHWMSLPEAPL